MKVKQYEYQRKGIFKKNNTWDENKLHEKRFCPADEF